MINDRNAICGLTRTMTTSASHLPFHSSFLTMATYLPLSWVVDGVVSAGTGPACAKGPRDGDIDHRR
jgi:hypothetical protein